MAVTTQDYNWPSSSQVTITGIGNPTGNPVPSDAVYVAGKNPEGELTGIAVTDEGYVETMPASGSVQHVIVDSSALPSGAATSANQSTEITSLQAIETNTTGIATAANQATEINSLSTIESNTTTANTTLSTIATNTTGIATAANQTTTNTTLSAIEDNQTNGNQIVQVSNFPATQPVSGIVSIDQTTPGTTNGVVVNSSALPTGASTSALQSAGNTSLTTIASATSAISAQLPAFLGSKPSTQSLSVTMANDQTKIPTSIAGTSYANDPVYNQYSLNSISTSAYTELVASTANNINTIHIFDSSGQAMILGIGASGVEVAQLYVPPGGDTYTLNIPSGSRIAYKALSGNATSGYLLMSFLQ